MEAGALLDSHLVHACGTAGMRAQQLAWSARCWRSPLPAHSKLALAVAHPVLRFGACVCVYGFVQYLTETTTMIEMYRKLAQDAGGWAKLTYGANTSGGFVGG